MGEWEEPQLHCSWADSTFNPPPAVKTEIDKVWHKLTERPGVIPAPPFSQSRVPLDRSTAMGRSRSDTAIKTMAGAARCA